MSTQELTAPLPAARRLPLPFEVWGTALFCAICALGLAAGLPVSLPIVQAGGESYNALLLPMLLVSVVQAGVVVLAARRMNLSDPYLLPKLLPLKIVSIVVFFNLKAWVPLVNPALYDGAYRAADAALAPVVSFFAQVRAAVAWAAPGKVDKLYVFFYLFPFVVSPVAHALWDSPRRLRQVVFGMCLVSYVGALCYFVAPAVGPFVYREGVNASASATQHIMSGMYEQVRATGQLPPGYFFFPPAAMPSLHVAHALFFTLYARKLSKTLFVFYCIGLAWITVECSASAWHYLVDIPAGVAVALIAHALVRRFIPEPASTAPPGRACG